MDPAAIVGEFATHLQEVYTSKVSYPLQDLENLLNDLTLPKLTTEQVDMLEAPLTADNINLAISHFAKAKALCTH